MPEPISITAAVIALIGTAVSVAGSIRAGQAQAAAAKFNARQQAAQQESEARLAEREAQQSAQALQGEQDASAFDLATLERQFARRESTRLATVGASGVEPTGSPLLVAIDEGREAALTLEAERYQSGLRRHELADQGTLATFQASELRRQAPVALGIGRARAAQFRQEATLTAIGTGLTGVASAGRTLLTPRGGTR